MVGETVKARLGGSRPPTDARTDPNRKKQEARERRMRRGFRTAIAGRGVSIVAGLVIVPVLLNHLGTARFGIWATITSLTLLLTFADLGLTNGLINAVADADARGDRGRMQREVSSVVALLSLVAVAIVVVFLLLSTVVDVGALVGATNAVPGDEVTAAVTVFVIGFAMGVPLNVALRIHMGLQESATTYFWLALGAGLGAIGTIVAVLLDGGLPIVVGTTVMGPVIASLLCALRLFGVTRPWLMPRLSRVKWHSAKLLLTAGGLWFVIQASVAVSYQSGALVISHVLGPAAVTHYTVPMRLFSLLPAVLSVALMPLWPAIRSALAQRDVTWVRQAFMRMTAIGAACVLIPTVGLLLAGPVLVDTWTGGAVTPSRALLLALSLWAATTCLVTPLAYLLAGANALGFQAVTNGVMAILNLLLSVSLAHRVGVAGVVYATVIANVTCIIVPSIIYVRRTGLEVRSPGAAVTAM
ncbi:MAG: hypothetical protein WKF96_08360 [Solirubrobacteraceae bacterium]